MLFLKLGSEENTTNRDKEGGGVDGFCCLSFSWSVFFFCFFLVRRLVDWLVDLFVCLLLF